jgi:hypothetical protein
MNLIGKRWGFLTLVDLFLLLFIMIIIIISLFFFSQHRFPIQRWSGAGTNDFTFELPRYLQRVGIHKANFADFSLEDAHSQSRPYFGFTH